MLKIFSRQQTMVERALQFLHLSRKRGANVRSTSITPELHFVLREAFAQDSTKQTQWKAFLRKNRLDAPPLEEVVEDISKFLSPVYLAALVGPDFPHEWTAQGTWSRRENN